MPRSGSSCSDPAVDGPTRPRPGLLRILTVTNLGSNPVGRPPDTNSAETRLRIIDSARDAFRTLGYAGATNMTVATGAGLTRPSVGYHFANKHDLFYAVVAHDVAVVDAALDRAAAEPTLVCRVRALVTAMDADTGVRAATEFLLFAAMERQRHPELRHDGHGDVCAGMRNFLATSVAAAMERGELRHNVAPSSVVATLYAFVSGMALYSGEAADGPDRHGRSDAVMLLLTGDLLNGSRRRADEEAPCVA